MRALLQQDVRACCERHGIVVVAYGSFGCGHLFSHPTVEAAAASEGVPQSVALLRWALKRGMCVIPKSVHAHRLQEVCPERVLADTLSDRAMQVLDTLQDGKKFCWDPSGIL